MQPSSCHERSCRVHLHPRTPSGSDKKIGCMGVERRQAGLTGVVRHQNPCLGLRVIMILLRMETIVKRAVDLHAAVSVPHIHQPFECRGRGSGRGGIGIG
jgi:hypothetical protein